MLFFHKLRRFGLMLAALSLLGIQIAPVQAAMVGNPQLLEQGQQQFDRGQLLDLMERVDVQQQLVALGVDPAAAKARVAAMTEAEIAQLNQSLADMPAGGVSVIGVLLIIFLVFVITDVLGATDIFPFIKPIR
jgi:hypothetical protein